MDARSDVDPGRAWYDAMCAGDERAFESLFRAYYTPLCRFLVHYLEPSVAEEIAQDLFLRLWRDRGQAPVRGSVRAYLYVAGRNAALNHLRHQRIHDRWRQHQRRLAVPFRETGVRAGVRTRHGGQRRDLPDRDVRPSPLRAPTGVPLAGRARDA